jgi:hypothetical protein
MLAPAFLRRRQNGVQDPIMLAKSDRLSELRQDDRPIALHELEVARNRAVRQMVRRLPEMKPQEVMTCVEVLDAEIAARKIAGAEAPEKREVTREEMLQTLQGSKQKEVQK